AEISLYRASSAVSELAPLILYLKFYIRQGSVLIIEEPEAHLHPANIMTLARFLVRLRRHGVNLVLTTHSEYLLEQLGNFIRLEKVAPDVRVSNYHYDRNDFLKADEVAVHMFKPDKKRGGFTIAALEVSPEEGISAEAFMEVHESLYDETVRLERDLMKVTGGRGDQ
ncbi:MAG: AAA family ATPase, partial [Deltaproteobacteria bacterium]|nr:AAA family ATPase [Deltaproteobacteria bacterium]